MKSKRFLGVAAAAIALAGFFAAPEPSSGQGGRTEAQIVAQLLGEVVAQQTAIIANQTQLEEKTALVAEEVRLARIYAGRTGGGAK